MAASFATVIISMLAKEIGPNLAGKVIGKLGSGSGSEGKLKKALEATEKGVSLAAALRDNFGDAFDVVLNEAANSGNSGWSFEAGTAEYVKISCEDGNKTPFEILRAELNINLDRLSSTANKNKIDNLNYFRGVFAEWKRRYETLIGVDEDASATFRDMSVLLDGSDRTFKDALIMLAKTTLGATGALMVIAAVMLATSTSVGLITWISTLIFGAPLMSVAALAIPGVLLLALTRVKFGQTHAMSACVALAYKLLERRVASAAA